MNMSILFCAKVCIVSNLTMNVKRLRLSLQIATAIWHRIWSLFVTNVTPNKLLPIYPFVKILGINANYIHSSIPPYWKLTIYSTPSLVKCCSPNTFADFKVPHSKDTAAF